MVAAITELLCVHQGHLCPVPSLTTTEVDIIVHFLWMRKLRPREIKELYQSHTVRR